MNTCKHCNSSLVWTGSMKDGRLECSRCNSNIPKYELHVQGQELANTVVYTQEEWINIYKHEGEDE